MNYIDYIASKLSEKEKNIVLNLSSGVSVTLINYIYANLAKHVDANGNVNFKGNIISAEQYVRNIIYNKSSLIDKFIIDNGGSLDILNNGTVQGDMEARKNDIDYTLTCQNYIYKFDSIESICIKDIIGTLSDDNSKTLEEMLNSLYNDTDNAYSSRGNKFLKEDISTNIERLKNNEDLINLAQIGDKFYLKGDGNHRIFYILLCYTLEKSKCKTKEELQLLDEKYTFKFNVSKKSNSQFINMVSYALIKSKVNGIQIINNANNNGISVIINEQPYMVSSEDEFIAVFIEYLENNYNENLINNLDSIGFFNSLNLNKDDYINNYNL